MVADINEFCLESFNDEATCQRYFNLFGLDKLLGLELAKGNSKNKAKTNVDTSYIVPYGVEIPDLCRLHWICISRKSMQILEFGSGYSTLVFASALSSLKDSHNEWAKENTRLEEPFKIFSIEESEKFAEVTKSRLDKYEDVVDLSVRTVSLTEINGRFCTLFDTLPNVMPDLIYLDGPSQFATDQNIAGFSINEKCRMPMAADLVRMEYFLEPGAIILVDGRAANATFLKNNFQRNWKHHHDYEGDFHIFELQDPFLGRLNKEKFYYCTNGNWLLDK
tara:strand:+ start:2455 stop:3288 length:834 start_codon:yes stop_codon:yes gene_type:complete